MPSENSNPQPPRPTSNPGEPQPRQTDLAHLTKIIEEGFKEHSPLVDGALFNGGTILTLILTAGSALLASKVLGDWAWLAATSSALATIIVGAERALSFGERWRYHIRMRNIYRVLLTRVARAATMREGVEKDDYVKGIWTALESVIREPDIPGIGGADQRQSGEAKQRPTQPDG